jgi:uncharacterized membrane protein
LNLQRVISATLRWGVALAAFVLACGGAAVLIQSSSATADFSALRPAAALAGGNGPVLIIRLGLFLLVATPVARVALCAIAFAVERDYVYSSISALVLAVLLYSIFGLH